MVRAKFYVEEKTQVSTGYRVKMLAVYAGTEENDKYFEATPYGSLEIGIFNEEAAKHFEVGKYYYLDFVHAPDL